MTDNTGKDSLKDTQEIEMAKYIADMLLELHNMAKSAGLPTLLGLLELSFCEAFSIANKVENLPEKSKNLNACLKPPARRDLANDNFQWSR